MDENTIKLFGSKKTDHWQTPQSLKEKMGVVDWFDPCPRHPTEDGLKIDWKPYTFVNPPYSDVLNWLKMAHVQLKLGHCDVIKFLIFSNTDTKWFHEWIYFSKTYQDLHCFVDVEFIKGRVSFIGDDGKTGPSMRPSMIVTFTRR